VKKKDIGHSYLIHKINRNDHIIYSGGLANFNLATRPNMVVRTQNYTDKHILNVQ